MSIATNGPEDVQAAIDNMNARAEPVGEPRRHPLRRLSAVQRQLVAAHARDSSGRAYTIPAVLRVRGPLDARAFAAAFRDVTRRHEILRMRIGLDGHGVTGWIAPDGVLPAIIDLRRTCNPSGERDRVVADVLRAPWDLDGFGALLRAVIVLEAGHEATLAVALHHVIADGLSMSVILADLDTCYRARRRGHEPTNDLVLIQYNDVVAAEAARASEPSIDAEQFWTSHLGGVDPGLSLPYDFRRRGEARGDGGHRQLDLGPGLRTRIEAFARQARCTPFAVLLAGYYVYLARLTGQDRVIVGVPTAVRAPRFRSVVGPLMTVLPVRGPEVEGRNFNHVVEDTARILRSCLRYQDVRPGLFVDALGAQHRTSTSVYQTTFTFLGENRGSFSLDDLELVPVQTDNGGAKFDFALSVAVTGDSYGLETEFATDVLAPSTADSLADAYRRMIANLLDAPGAPATIAPMIDPTDAAAVIDRCRPTHSSVQHSSLVDGFASCVAHTPDATAVVDGTVRLTYRELDRTTTRFANGLQERGVRPGDRVGLLLQRGRAQVIAIVGVLKAGACYVPLDVGYPAARIAATLDDCRPRMLVVSKGIKAPHDLPTVETDDDGEIVGPAAGGGPLPTRRPDDIAYVIYTSGSTGTPKGVAVQDRSVRRLVSETSARLAFDGSDAWTMFHSYAFDVSVWEMWGALLTGGRVVTVTSDVARSPRRLLDVVTAERITIFSQTPSAFRGFVREDATCGHTHTLAVRAVVLAGERLEVATLAPWFSGRAAARVINMYGITETTIHTSYREITKEDLARPESSPIGHALADSSLYLLDDAMNPVPPGVPGELYVGGPGVAVGYLTRGGQTAERFVPDPFSGRRGARLYRSGDRARQREDGELESLGRRDKQVKIRGFRVELGEIESVLESFPAVTAAVADVRNDAGPEATLVVYFSLAEDQSEPSVEALRAHCAALLPQYMVPAVYVSIPAIPHTMNGKVDRRALPAPSSGRLVPGTPHEPPFTPIQNAIAGIWGQVLGVEALSVHDNFFAMGGDSMRALEAVAQLRAAGLVADVQAIYRWQTIAELASHVEPIGVPAPEPTQPYALVSAADAERLSLSGYVDAYPLTAAQAGILYHRLALGSGIYHNTVSVRLTGRVAEEPLWEAIRLVIRRHPIFRTGFETSTGSEPLQVVAEDAEPRLTFVDLRRSPPDEVRDRVAADLAAERRNEFDLTEPPLFRMLVHQTGDEVFHLTISDNHLVLDGWSWTATVAEIFRYQAEIMAGHAPAVPPPPAPYADLVRREIEAARCDADQVFWQEQLAGAVPAKAADLRPAGGPAVRRRTVGIERGVVRSLGTLARRHGLPLKSLVLGIHYWVLGQVSGAEQVISGVAFNGRPERAGAADMRGLFVNVLPLRGPARERFASWIDHARAIHALESQALGHRWFPASRVQAEYGIEPLFDTCFTYVHFHPFKSVQDVGLIGFDGEPRIPAATEDTHYALVVAFSVHPPEWKLGLVLAYDTARVSDERVEQLSELYRHGLGRMAEELDAPSTCRRPTPRMVIGPASLTSGPAPTLLDGVRDAAELSPDRVAVRSVGGNLTYRELDRWASVVAERLTSMGVRRGDRLAAALTPDRAALPITLGVLRAGAVCVPVEPGQPADRLADLVGALKCAAIIHSDTDGALESMPSLSLFSDCSESRPSAPTRVGCDDDAFILWTAGTTGLPKPVTLTHGNIASSLSALNSLLRLDAGDVHGAFGPFGSDVALWETWAPLVIGATLWLPPAMPPTDLTDLVGMLTEQGVTGLRLSPTNLAAILPALHAAADELRLRRVLLTREAVDAEILRRWFAHPMSTSCELYNGYGSTETAGPITLHRFTAADAHRTRARIGGCLPGTHLEVLDEGMAPVPHGGVGELYVGGAQLGQGYHNHVAETAGRFVPDPFSSAQGARLYRTGDRVRFLDDWILEFIGRCGPPIDIRGRLVDLCQIESAGRSHPDVLDCVAEVTADGAYGRLVLCVVPREARAPDRNSVRNHLTARLATHAIPTSVVQVPALATLPNGTVDRRALPTTEPADDHPPPDGVLHPRTPVEEVVREIWQQHLGVVDLGIEDHFFELGGHSLLATRVLLTAQERFGVPISVTDLMADFTIAGMARVIDARLEAAVAGLGDDEVVQLLHDLEESNNAP